MTGSGAWGPSESGGAQGARESNVKDCGVGLETYLLRCDSTLGLCRMMQFLKRT